MKIYISFFALGAMVSALGTPVLKRATLVERDLPTMSSAFDNIIVNVQQLKDSLAAFNGSIDEVGPLYQRADRVISALTNSSAIVEDTSPITQEEAIVIANQTTALAKLVNTTIITLIDKKPKVIEANVGNVVFIIFGRLSSLSDSYTEIVISKLTGYAKGAARQFSDPIAQSFLVGLKAYQDQAPTVENGTATIEAAEKAASAHISANLPLTIGGYAVVALAACFAATVV